MDGHSRFGSLVGWFSEGRVVVVAEDLRGRAFCRREGWLDFKGVIETRYVRSRTESTEGRGRVLDTCGV